MPAALATAQRALCIADTLAGMRSFFTRVRQRAAVFGGETRLRAREATTQVGGVIGAASVLHAAPGQQEERVPVSVPKPAPNKSESRLTLGILRP